MAERTERRNRWIFLCIVVSGIASSMLSTAMTTALPSVVQYFGVTTATGQWITSGYSLAMGIALPLTAFLITRFPTKRLYLSGLGVFLVGLLLSLFAPDFRVMMVGRVCQATGNAVLMSSAQVIILTIFPKEKAGTMMGTYGLAAMAAPIVAPTLAGLMIDAFGWQSIFEAGLVVIFLSFLLAALVFEDVLELQDRTFDVRSFLESVLAFGGVTLGVGNVMTYGLVSLGAGLPLVVGLAASVLFVRRQCALPTPFLDVKILADRSYRVSVVSSCLLYFVMMGSSVLMPLYVQVVMGRSAVLSGLVMLPGSLASALISPFAGRIYDRLGIRKLFLTGAVATVVSNLGMTTLSLAAPLWVAALWNLVRSVAIGALLMPLLTWGVSRVEARKISDASSLLTSLRTIAGAIGAAVFVGIMDLAGGTEAAAQLHGMHASFLVMTASAVVLLLVALLGVKKTQPEPKDYPVGQ